MAVELPDGVKVRAYRDGLIEFAPGPDGPSYPDEFPEWASLLMRLMNAHLACLHTAMGELGGFHLAVATPFTTIQVDFESDESFGMSDGTGGTVGALWHARWESDADTVRDWRFYRSMTIPEDRMQESFELLRDLLNRPQREKVLLRAEMLARSMAAQGAVDPSGALTYAWSVMEGLLNDLLHAYLVEKEHRAVTDREGQPADFFNAKRWNFLEGSQMTIRHVVEFLSLLDRLPFHLYQAALQCARARNKWLHAEETPKQEIVGVALEACADLFEMVEGVRLRVVRVYQSA